MNHFIAQTPVQFIRKVAIDYVRFGYWYYALRQVPDGKDVGFVDRKLIDCYNITTCRTTRARHRQKGLASVVFVRYQHRFVLLATQGMHPQFNAIRSYDIRTAPLHFENYSIGVQGDTPCVRVCSVVWQEVERRFTILALKISNEELEQKLASLPYANFPGVIRQKFALIQMINQRRKRAGLPLVKLSSPKKKYGGQ